MDERHTLIKEWDLPQPAARAAVPQTTHLLLRSAKASGRPSLRVWGLGLVGHLQLPSLQFVTGKRERVQTLSTQMTALEAEKTAGENGGEGGLEERVVPWVCGGGVPLETYLLNLCPHSYSLLTRQVYLLLRQQWQGWRGENPVGRRTGSLLNAACNCCHGYTPYWLSNVQRCSVLKRQGSKVKG